MNDQADTSAVPATGAEAGFQPSAPLVTVSEENAPGALAAVAREMYEIEAASKRAAARPRDEALCYSKILSSCERPGFAEGGLYRFPRGGGSVEGPSVKLARECARNWGNMRYGHRVTAVTDERTTIAGFALDLETNTLRVAEISVKNLIQRKNKNTNRTEWVKPDERDYIELVSRNGAKSERNAVLAIMPPDLIDDACRTVRTTMQKAARGEIEQDREATIRRLVHFFRGYGVSKEMVEAKLKHGLETMTPEELTELRAVAASVMDGNSKIGEHFDFGHDAPAEPAKAEVDAQIESGDGDGKKAEKEDSPQPKGGKRTAKTKTAEQDLLPRP